MKKNHKILGLFALGCSNFLALGASPSPSPVAANPAAVAPAKTDAESIIAKIEKNLGPTNVKARYAFTNYRTDGTVMNYEVQFEMRDATHSRGLFVKPERDKGREVLRIDDNIWTYAPSVGRIIRIADRDSFAGGDFSNADVLRADWSAKYNSEILKELPKQWILELKAKSPEAPYAKMRLWVDKSNGQPVQQQYYDSKGTLLKKCLYGSVQTFSSKLGTIERPAHLLMENVISKQKSELKVQELEAVGTIADSRFVIDNLGK